MWGERRGRIGERETVAVELGEFTGVGERERRFKEERGLESRHGGLS